MTHSILAVDPGPVQSAWIVFQGEPYPGIVLNSAIHDNHTLENYIEAMACNGAHDRPEACAIERVACYGMRVGQEVFETCFAAGRLAHAWDLGMFAPAQRIYRRDVKLHLCNSVRAKDADVRAALIDRFGPGKDKAVGTKAAPGPLYGLKRDLWAALAIAVTVADQLRTGAMVLGKEN
ncbi:MAG TPA: hypothetical protein VM238_18640 [Phycisphaerae bacterium]|nr:hypothetical protein [Phycisphaerae bacterium]